MKVFVAGHNGMLGHVAVKYFSQNGCEVLTSDERYNACPDDRLIEEIRNSGCDWVVNALGRIKQKSQNAAELFKANTLFPVHLKRLLRSDQRMVHASSDCVFSGRGGSYAVNAIPDAEDEYGLSKALAEIVAEPGRAAVLRTSIIGVEKSGHAGLMSWFLEQKGSVNGFINHFWNGITTLEWAKVCLEIMRGQHSDHGAICQPGVWPPVSKFQLLEMIKNVWGHSVDINAHDAPTSVDRSLQPTLVRATHHQQLIEMKLWLASESRL